MERLHMLFYLQEIQTQCRMVRIAFVSLSRWPHAYPPFQTIEEGAVSTAAFFRDMHSMLTHVGVISKLIWPIKNRADTQRIRGEALRTRLELPLENHMLHKRFLRDDLEHFDERLDRWADQQKILQQAGDRASDYWQDCIGPWAVVHQQYRAAEHNVMRHYDPDTHTYRFQGRALNVQELDQAVAKLKQRVDDEVTQLLAQLYPVPDASALPSLPHVMPS